MEITLPWCYTYLDVMCREWESSCMTLDASSFTELVLVPSAWSQELVHHSNKQTEYHKEY